MTTTDLQEHDPRTDVRVRRPKLSGKWHEAGDTREEHYTFEMLSDAMWYYCLFTAYDHYYRYFNDVARAHEDKQKNLAARRRDQFRVLNQFMGRLRQEGFLLSNPAMATKTDRLYQIVEADYHENWK